MFWPYGDPRTAGCFSEHISSSPSLPSLSPNPDAPSHNYFSSQCFLLSIAHLYARLIALFYTGYSFLQPYSPFSY